jgi:hypothetical protein
MMKRVQATGVLGGVTFTVVKLQGKRGNDIEIVFSKDPETANQELEISVEDK